MIFHDSSSRSFVLFIFLPEHLTIGSKSRKDFSEFYVSFKFRPKFSSWQYFMTGFIHALFDNESDQLLQESQEKPFPNACSF